VLYVQNQHGLVAKTTGADQAGISREVGAQGSENFKQENRAAKSSLPGGLCSENDP